MKITFSKHALQKIKERKIRIEMIEEVLSNSESLFYDLIEKTIVAVAKVKIDDIQTNFVVVFTKKDKNRNDLSLQKYRQGNKEKGGGKMGKNVKVWFDEETDILYVSLREGISVDSEEVAEDVRVEYDKQGQIIGVEIYNITKMLAKSLARQLRETVKA